MSTTHADPDLAAVTAGVLAKARRELALDAREFPTAVREQANEYTTAISEILAAGTRFEADLAELRKNRNMLPLAGQQELRTKALAEAQERSSSGARRAQRALDGLKAALTEAAIPTLDPNREQLARQELATAVGDAQGREAAKRVRAIANGGSREALAVLLRTSYGQTLLSGRGLNGTDLAETLTHAKTIAAGNAPKHGGTMREKLAGAALPRLPALGAALGGATSYVAHVTRVQ